MYNPLVSLNNATTSYPKSNIAFNSCKFAFSLHLATSGVVVLQLI